MKKYRFTILGSNAERMWDFAMANQVNIHFVKTKGMANNVSTDLYTYEGFMDKATFVAFCLTVQVESTQ